MRTRIKQCNGRYFPQYRKWLLWFPIEVSVEACFGKPFEKSCWWVRKENAEKAVDKFIRNGYCNDD